MKFTMRGRWPDGQEGSLTWDNGKIYGDEPFLTLAINKAKRVEAKESQPIPWGELMFYENLLTDPVAFWALAAYMFENFIPFRKGEVLEVTGDIPEFPDQGLDFDPESIRKHNERMMELRRQRGMS